MGLADSVFRLFRENSDVVPLNRLKKQGVKNVTVLDWERVQKLIEKAVLEALARRRIDLEPHVLAGVHQEAREAFHRLLEQRDHLEIQRDHLEVQRDHFAEAARTLEQEKAQLAANLDALRAEIGRSSAQLAAERTRAIRLDDVPVEGAQLDHVIALLEERVRSLIGGGAAGAGADPGLAAAIAAAARGLLDAERRSAFDHAAKDHQHKIEQLERRLAKLQRTLSDTEQVVDRLKTAKDGDSGIESIYRSVQGLDAGEARATEKRGLLDQVFRLNVELRDVIAQAEAASDPAATSDPDAAAPRGRAARARADGAAPPPREDRNERPAKGERPEPKKSMTAEG